MTFPAPRSLAPRTPVARAPLSALLLGLIASACAGPRAHSVTLRTPVASPGTAASTESAPPSAPAEPWVGGGPSLVATAGEPARVDDDREYVDWWTDDDLGGDGEGSAFWARRGGYVGFGLTVQDVEGDFEGDTVIVGDTDVTIVPEIDLDGGFELMLGYRGEQFAFEIGYQYVQHEGEFFGVTDDDDFHAIDVDFKQFYLTSTPVQPYLLLGLGYLFAYFDNASSDGIIVARSRLTGVSVNVGVGLAYYLTRRVALDAQAVYRFAEYLDVDGATETGSIDGDLDGDTYGVTVGLTYTF